MPQPVMLRSWTVLWRPTRPSRTNTPKRCHLHYRVLECKSRKSRNTWSNRQIWPWSTKWSRSKANRVLPRERTGHSKHPLPKTQEKTLHMDITRWSIPKSDYVLCIQRWTSCIQSAKTRMGGNCSSDQKLLIAKFRHKLKEVGKTTRPFKCDLNKIPYIYTVEVINRFKRLDLIDWVPEELWMEVHDIIQEAVIKTIPKEKKCKKAKWLSEEGLQIDVKRREVKSKGEKERYTH